MAGHQKTSHPDSESLLEIIHVQAEIARLGQDLGGVMALVAQRAMRLTGASGAVVELAEGEEMVYRATAGFADRTLGMRLQRQGSISGLCVERGEPLNCHDSETDPRVNREACRRVGLRSMVVAPLTHLDHVVGVLKVMAAEPDAFGEEQVKLLGLMSGLIASATFHAGRAAEDALFHRATHDPLTGLGNRALFYDRLRQRHAQAGRHGERFGVLNLDMDGLKQVNDRLGHRAGDAVIREFSVRLKQASRHSDTVARTGGDEFGVVLDRLAGREEAEEAARRVGEQVSRPFRFEGEQLPLGASIGWALCPDDAADLEGLLEKADQAMYVNKKARKAAAP